MNAVGMLYDYPLRFYFGEFLWHRSRKPKEAEQSSVPLPELCRPGAGIQPAAHHDAGEPQLQDEANQIL